MCRHSWQLSRNNIALLSTSNPQIKADMTPNFLRNTHNRWWIISFTAMFLRQSSNRRSGSHQNHCGKKRQFCSNIKWMCIDFLWLHIYCPQEKLRLCSKYKQQFTLWLLNRLRELTRRKCTNKLKNTTGLFSIKHGSIFQSFLKIQLWKIERLFYSLDALLAGPIISWSNMN